MNDFNRVAVLGAGTMGAGIAGICANAGCGVLLMDVDAATAEAAKQRLSQGRAPVCDADALARITCGSIACDLDDIAQLNCEWICEAVVEDLSVKRDLFARVEAARAPDSILSTNTSGIPLREICAGQPARLQQDIAVTHFFNPAHIMRLVELVPGENTRPEVLDSLSNFFTGRLGKGVVRAKDTVNFIANRIGCFWLLAGLHLAEEARRAGVAAETVDAVTSAPLGLPPAAGLYGLIDLIGLDVMANVGANLAANLPADDAGRRYTDLPDAVQRMLERGQLGRKTGGGFYQLTRHDDGSKSMRVFDLGAEDWRAAAAVALPAEAQTAAGLFAGGGDGGGGGDGDGVGDAAARFFRALATETLVYAAGLVPAIADDIVSIDRAMRWGFNWRRGPFELCDDIGGARLAAEASARGLSPPALLTRAVEAGGFYRDAGGGREYLSITGNWSALPAGD